MPLRAVVESAVPRVRQWLLPAVLGAAGLAAESGGDALRGVLRYSRAAIEDGEWWRLLTGHVAHLGWPHFAMNAAALGVIWLLFGRRLKTGQWCVVTLVAVVAMDAGFWWLDPGLGWYVGLSGLLHGLLAAGLLQAPRGRRGEALLLGGLLAAKLAFEQAVGALPGSAEAAGGAVVVNAHLYGALGGAAGVLLVRIRGWRPESL